MGSEVPMVARAPTVGPEGRRQLNENPDPGGGLARRPPREEAQGRITADGGVGRRSACRLIRDRSNHEREFRRFHRFHLGLFHARRTSVSWVSESSFPRGFPCSLNVKKKAHCCRHGGPSRATDQTMLFSSFGCRSLPFGRSPDIGRILSWLAHRRCYRRYLVGF